MGRAQAAIALVVYGIVRITESPEIDSVVSDFYHRILGPHWPAERRHVEDGYRSLPFPFREIDAPELAMEASWALPDFLGYIGTWSAVRALERVAGDAPVDAFRRDLALAWGPEATVRPIQWPLSLRVGHLDRGRR